MSAADLLDGILTRILTTRLASALDGERRDWLLATKGASLPALGVAFTVAPRKLGTATVELDAGEKQKAEAAGLLWLAAPTTASEIARVAFAIAASAPERGGGNGVLDEWYRQGDNAEKQAVLRALPFVSDPAAHAELGATACRSNVQSVFEALCCENPFPARAFSDLAFNQMVLKALFTGVALERIHGLAGRKNADLARMAAGYASERSAAGRSVPADIGLLAVD